MQISISPSLSHHNSQTQKQMDSGFLWKYLYRMVRTFNSDNTYSSWDEKGKATARSKWSISSAHGTQ